MKNSGKTFRKNAAIIKSDERSDRKSSTGMNGMPKKGGLGGKYTWYGDRCSLAEAGFERDIVDVKDPNFIDPEDISKSD